MIELNLRDTKVTDAGLRHLKGWPKLRALGFRVTKITDTGLMHLKGLTELRRLDLRFTENITHAGVAELQKALPACEISK